MYLFFLNPARGFIPAAISARLAQLQQGKQPAEAYVYDDDADGWSLPSGTAPLPYQNHNGIAVFEVSGALASCQIPGWYWYANLTYENLTNGLAMAVKDPDVRAILIKANSPGGSVTGCAEAADVIDRMSREKPIWTHCQQADSAAYWLASATNRITTDPTGETGSIGVICTHMDFSKALEQWGIKVTMLFAGKHKADGNPYEPLDDDAKKTILADMEYLRGQFVASVAKYRGAEDAAIKATEAKTYIGENAVREGLADATGFSHDILAELDAFAQTENPQPTTRSEDMAKTQTAPKNPQADAGGKKPSAENDKPEDKDEDKEDPAASEDDKEDDEEEPAAGSDEKDDKAEAAAARKAERERISKIMNAPEAKNRQALAQHLATKTDMSPEDAVSALKASPEEKAAAPANPLAAAMAGKNPSVNPGDAGASNANPLVTDMQNRFKKK